MSLYAEYLNEIEERKKQGLSPKPIDGADLIKEVIAQIKDTSHEHRKDSLNFFIYNTIIVIMKIYFFIFNNRSWYKYF